jgi:hypothetical protein
LPRAQLALSVCGEERLDGEVRRRDLEWRSAGGDDGEEADVAQAGVPLEVAEDKK